MITTLINIAFFFLPQFILTQKQQNSNDPPLFPFTPETGYLNVLPENNPDKSNNQMFYWIFRAKNSPTTAPLLIWLDGGPGCAGTFGLFFNIGPFQVNNFKYDPTTGKYTGDKKADLRETSWHANYNVLFPDNPIGVGFSTNQDQYLPKNEAEATGQFVAFLLNFLEKYPEFKARPIILTGASFGGHWAPFFGSALINLNNPDVNIQGLVIASGLMSNKELY